MHRRVEARAEVTSLRAVCVSKARSRAMDESSGIDNMAKSGSSADSARVGGLFGQRVVMDRVLPYLFAERCPAAVPVLCGPISGPRGRPAGTPSGDKAWAAAWRELVWFGLVSRQAWLRAQRVAAAWAPPLLGTALRPDEHGDGVAGAAGGAGGSGGGLGAEGGPVSGRGGTGVASTAPSTAVPAWHWLASVPRWASVVKRLAANLDLQRTKQGPFTPAPPQGVAVQIMESPPQETWKVLVVPGKVEATAAVYFTYTDYPGNGRNQPPMLPTAELKANFSATVRCSGGPASPRPGARQPPAVQLRLQSDDDSVSARMLGRHPRGVPLPTPLAPPASAVAACVSGGGSLVCSISLLALEAIRSIVAVVDERDARRSRTMATMVTKGGDTKVPQRPTKLVPRPTPTPRPLRQSWRPVKKEWHVYLGKLGARLVVEASSSAPEALALERDVCALRTHLEGVASEDYKRDCERAAAPIMNVPCAPPSRMSPGGPPGRAPRPPGATVGSASSVAPPAPGTGGSDSSTDGDAAASRSAAREEAAAAARAEALRRLRRVVSQLDSSSVWLTGW